MSLTVTRIFPVMSAPGIHAMSDKFAFLEELGNNLVKLIGTYEVVLWRVLALYIAVRHFLGI
jgi:hypothetical protein